jgi:hypothetical protein
MSEEQLNEAMSQQSLRRDDLGTIWSIERSHCETAPCPFNIFGQVVLRNGKVGFISKQWLLNETPATQVAFAGALYGAFLSTTGGGETDCHVSYSTIKEPNTDREGVTVECPKGAILRRVIVSHYRTTITGVNGPVINASIQEILTTREWAVKQ